MRTLWIALLLLGCGKSKGTAPQTNGSGSAVTPTVSDAARPAIDDDEPKAPPPPPTTRPGSKGDCKTEYAPKPNRDPNPMCKIDGGTLEMVDGTDKMTVKLSPYYIDQFEVTNAQVAHYLNSAHSPCLNDPSVKHCFHVDDGSESAIANARFVVRKPDGTFGVVPGYESRPFDDATKDAAAEYCAWVGKQLPTEPQWEFAARHDPASGKDFIYPWGDDFVGTLARCIEENCPNLGGAKATNQPAPVGSYPEGQSPWGVFDMAGNVREHVADCSYAYRPCASGPCIDPPPHGPRNGRCEDLLRGGGAEGSRQLRAINRGYTMPTGGIRCARAAP